MRQLGGHVGDHREVLLRGQVTRARHPDRPHPPTRARHEQTERPEAQRGNHARLELALVHHRRDRRARRRGALRAGCAVRGEEEDDGARSVPTRSRGRREEDTNRGHDARRADATRATAEKKKKRARPSPRRHVAGGTSRKTARANISWIGWMGGGVVMNGSEWRLGAREACVPLRKRLPHSRPRQHCIAAPRRAKRRRRSRPRPEVARTRGSPAPTRFWSAPPKTQPDRDVRRPQARPGRARRRARRTRRRVRFHHRMCGGRARSETPPRWVSPRARW